jgi:hypothetical protein
MAPYWFLQVVEIAPTMPWMPFVFSSYFDTVGEFGGPGAGGRNSTQIQRRINSYRRLPGIE